MAYRSQMREMHQQKTTTIMKKDDDVQCRRTRKGTKLTLHLFSPMKCNAIAGTEIAVVSPHKTAKQVHSRARCFVVLPIERWMTFDGFAVVVPYCVMWNLWHTDIAHVLQSRMHCTAVAVSFRRRFAATSAYCTLHATKIKKKMHLVWRQRHCVCRRRAMCGIFFLSSCARHFTCLSCFHSYLVVSFVNDVKWMIGAGIHFLSCLDVKTATMKMTTSTMSAKTTKQKVHEIRMQCRVGCCLHWIVDDRIPFVLFTIHFDVQLRALKFVSRKIWICCVWVCVAMVRNYFVNRLQLAKSSNAQEKHRKSSVTLTDLIATMTDHHRRRRRRFPHSTFKYTSFSWEYIAFIVLFLIGIVAIGFTWLGKKERRLRNRPRFTLVSHDRENPTVARLCFSFKGN